ncbi:hypothetical protein PsorP6_017670 [Peronosclerospora sorghi]|uniref:Uncharacterized protein n=1 Tax=Peronosclerospora sorghi TaxID=230839 RepID=A0ACC0WMS5_9STRA|nr:hypothetical protein PsorP6_017670 [Peronosclerospora sorghi]
MFPPARFYHCRLIPKFVAVAYLIFIDFIITASAVPTSVKFETSFLVNFNIRISDIGIAQINLGLINAPHRSNLAPTRITLHYPIVRLIPLIPSSGALKFRI